MLTKIEQFVANSEGQWSSMRSGHSLAFKQFEQIISKVTIKLLDKNDPNVLELINSNPEIKGIHIAPFNVEWAIEDDWDLDKTSEQNFGSSILIPIPKTNHTGFLLRSIGYTEPIQSIAKYEFLNDGTFILKTKYNKTITEERIWFLSKNVRCRSSVIYTSKGAGIIQTSFSSEIKSILNNG